MCKSILCQYDTLNVMSYYNFLCHIIIGSVCAISKGLTSGISHSGFVYNR